MRCLPICGHVSTTVWLHHLCYNEMLGEKAKCKLYKNAACCFEQILEAAPYKTATVLSFATIQVRWIRYAGNY